MSFQDGYEAVVDQAAELGNIAFQQAFSPVMQQAMNTLDNTLQPTPEPPTQTLT